MRKTAPKLILVLIGALLLTGCGVTVKESALRRGIFMHTNRDFPNGAQIGEPASPLKLTALGSRPNPPFRGRLTSDQAPNHAGNVTTNSVQPLAQAAFHGPHNFGQAVDGADSVVIFVHGFNANAADAAEKAILLDREFQERDHNAVLLFYTWPTSRNYLQVAIGGALQKVSLGQADAVLNDVYLGDRKNVDLAANGLYELIQEIAERYPNLEIDIVAHSLGSEVVLKSFLLWHYYQLIEDRPSTRVRRIRRVTVIGADVGVDTFRILSRPSGVSTEQLLVYLNPRDKILSTSTELNDERRIGAATLDKPIAGVGGSLNFIEIRDPLLPRGRKWIRTLLVNHNPLEDPRIRDHVCGFIATGRVEQGSKLVDVEHLTTGDFEGAEAGYYRLRFPSAEGLAGMGQATVEATGAAVDIVTKPGRMVIEELFSPASPKRQAN